VTVVTSHDHRDTTSVPTIPAHGKAFLMDGDDRRTLEDAITLIAATCQRSGYELTRTKLVKLLYFVDVRAWERSGRVLTGVDWMWHNYGPYSAEIVSTCDRMATHDEISIKMTSNFYGSPQYRITTVTEGYYQRPEVGVVELVREVVAEFGNKPPAKIGDLSYETIPMRRLIESGGVRGDIIEFPSAPPSASAVQRTAAKYAGLIRRADDDGDVAEGLRDEADATAAGRRSGTQRQLIG
jgi:hypothetical protein